MTADQPIILIVDDDEELLDELKGFLEASGFKVFTASDGAAGLRLLAEEDDVAVVVLDVLMPLVDGMTVLRTIRERRIATRVIVLTGYATDVEDVVEFVKTGACDYLIKPATPTDVLDAVRKAIELDAPMTPVVAELASEAKRLYSEVRDLKHRYAKLRQKYGELRSSRVWAGFVVKVTSLAVALLVTAIMYLGRVVSDGRLLAVLAGVLFVLLLIPLNRVRFLSARYRGLQISTRMDKPESGD